MPSIIRLLYRMSLSLLLTVIRLHQLSRPLPLWWCAPCLGHALAVLVLVAVSKAQPPLEAYFMERALAELGNVVFCSMISPRCPSSCTSLATMIEL